MGFIDIHNSQWWEADTPYSWPANSFYSARNVDIRKKWGIVTLEAGLVDSWWVISGNICYMINLDEIWVTGGWIIVCTETWNIYLNWVLKTTINTWTTVHNRVAWIWANQASNGTMYIYYITQTSFGSWVIHRSTTNLWTFNISYRTYDVAPWSVWIIKTINRANSLYIPVKNKVLNLNNLEVINEYLILQNTETIKYMSQFQWNMRVYSNLWNTCIQYIWDWYSILPDWRQEWYNQPILWWVSIWWLDYITIWFNENYADLYVVSGIQKQEVRINLDASNISRVFDSYLSIRQWMVYISGWQTWASSEYWIYTLWNYYPWQPISLVQSYTWWNNKFLQHCHLWPTSYFACVDNKVYTVEHNDPPTNYAPSGYIEELVYMGDDWEEVEFEWLKIAFKLNWWTINIYVREDIGKTYQLLKSIDSTYNNEEKLTIYKSEFINLWIWFLTKYQFKFELVKWATGTPQIWRRSVSLPNVNQHK